MSATIFTLLSFLFLMAFWSFKRIIKNDHVTSESSDEKVFMVEDFGLDSNEDKYLVKSLELLARREWIHRHLVEDSPKVTTYMKLELKRLERERKHYVEGLKKRGIVDI